jgi:hypothetical protein
MKLPPLNALRCFEAAARPRGHLQTPGGGSYLMKRGLHGPEVDLPHLR